VVCPDSAGLNVTYDFGQPHFPLPTKSEVKVRLGPLTDFHIIRGGPLWADALRESGTGAYPQPARTPPLRAR
jgi:hypothetical protein